MTKLLYDYNVVHLELFAMRNLFKHYIGHNMCHSIALSLLAAFAALFVDLRMAVLLLLLMFIVDLFATFPFFFANAVIAEVSLQNLKLNYKPLLIMSLIL